jgi:hypothetical protein
MPIHHVTYAMPKCKKCTKEIYTYATKKLPHTNSRNHQLLKGRQKGLDTTGKTTRKHKPTSSP